MIIQNTSYKVQSDVNTDVERLAYNVENGAYVTTESGVWTVQNGNWVKIYPSGGEGSGGIASIWDIIFFISKIQGY